MRLPKTARRPVAPLGEVALGKGDYVAGGACSLPFLDLDGARRRRPLVFGEVTDCLSDYPALAAEMFSGRHNDPAEWAVMWKEIGADGIWIDLKKGDSELVRTIVERTRLPVAVTADHGTLAKVAEIEGSVIILIGRGEQYLGPAGGHAVMVNASTPDSLADRCLEAESSGMCSIIMDVGNGTCFAEEVRRRALEGERSLRHPTICNVSGCWESGFSDARSASMWEAEAALSAMLAGTDILIVRGPGAADMARVYGEELADL